MQFGYADLAHEARGLHLRQFSRAFIVDDQDDVISHRAVYVVAEMTMMTHALRQGVSTSVLTSHKGTCTHVHRANMMFSPVTPYIEAVIVGQHSPHQSQDIERHRAEKKFFFDQIVTFCVGLHSVKSENSAATCT